jgi:hypothetical protein
MGLLSFIEGESNSGSFLPCPLCDHGIIDSRIVRGDHESVLHLHSPLFLKNFQTIIIGY